MVLITTVSDGLLVLTGSTDTGSPNLFARSLNFSSSVFATVSFDGDKGLEDTGVTDSVCCAGGFGDVDKVAAAGAVPRVAVVVTVARGTIGFAVSTIGFEDDWFSFEKVSKRAINSSFLPVTAKECLDNSDYYD